MFLGGGSVVGSAVDININAPPPAGWGMALGHGIIDDDATVRAFIVNQLLLRIPQ